MIVKIKLPDGAQLIPKLQTDVSIGNPLYSSGSPEIHSIQVAEKLKINPHDIFAFTVVVVGDEVHHDSIIAEKKGLMRKKRVNSPVQGIVARIDHENGVVSININGDTTQKHPSFFNGKIVSYDENTSILEAEIKGAIALENTSEITMTGGGELYFINDEQDYFHINESDVLGKHIVMNSAKPQIVSKLEALSADGIIAQEGEVSQSFPVILLSESSHKKLSSHKYNYIIYSSHSNTIMAYNN